MGIGSGAGPGRCGASQRTFLRGFPFRTCRISALMGQVNIPEGKGQSWRAGRHFSSPISQTAETGFKPHRICKSRSLRAPSMGLQRHSNGSDRAHSHGPQPRSGALDHKPRPLAARAFYAHWQALTGTTSGDYGDRPTPTRSAALCLPPLSRRRCLYGPPKPEMSGPLASPQASAQSLRSSFNGWGLLTVIVGASSWARVTRDKLLLPNRESKKMLQPQQKTSKNVKNHNCQNWDYQD